VLKVISELKGVRRLDIEIELLLMVRANSSTIPGHVRGHFRNSGLDKVSDARMMLMSRSMIRSISGRSLLP